MSFLDNIKSVPITDYASRKGFTVIKKGKYYSMKEHDSCIIDSYKNCFWRNSSFSKGFKGGAGSIIDFAMEFCGISDYKGAMRDIAVMYGIEGEKAPKITFEPLKSTHREELYNTTKVFELPKKDANNNAVFRYLFHERKIDKEVIRYFLGKKLLFQDVKKNCVFHTKHFACLRSTGEKKFIGDVEGCDYNECFFFKGNSNASTLIVAESVIDVMSVITILKEKGKMYQDYAYLALSGTNKLFSLFYHLEKEPNITKVVLCFDNDVAGDKATVNAINGISERFSSVSCVEFKAKGAKDWNEFLQKREETKADVEN